MADTATETKRKIRTPEQIAADDMEAATKRVESAQARVKTAEAEVTKAKTDLQRARRLADHAASHPDLPDNLRPDAAAVGASDAGDRSEIDREDVSVPAST